ncbi:MAG: hypothetical protein WD648_10185 [Planctomycetaceae bacterium]
MIVGDLKVVLLRDRLRVAHPGANHVARERFFQFRLTGRAQVLKEFWPGFQSRAVDDLQKPRAQVGVVLAARYDVLRLLRRAVERLFQVGQQFGEDWHHPRFPPFVVFGFRAAHAKAAMLPVDVAPRQGMVLRRATQAAVAAQRDNQTPFRVRAGIEHLFRLGAGNEVIAFAIRQVRRLELGERVLGDDALLEREIKELLREAGPLVDRGLGKLARLLLVAAVEARFEPVPPAFRVARGDLPQRFVFAKKIDQVAARLPPDDGRCRLRVLAHQNVVVEKRPELGLFTPGNQSDRGQLVAQRAVQLGEPAARFIVEGLPGNLGGNDLLAAQLDRLNGPQRDLAQIEGLARSVGGIEHNAAPTFCVGRNAGHVEGFLCRRRLHVGCGLRLRPPT